MKIQTKGSVRRLNRATRFATARAFVGKTVEVERHYLTEPDILRGKVISVALAPTGGSADVLVLRHGVDRIDAAYSLAQIEWIKEVDA